jgi:carbon storage regulator
MLVLSRKQGQRIRIGDSIELVVTEVRGDKVRLGFTAPPDVAIHREEIYRRINGQPAETVRADAG